MLPVAMLVAAVVCGRPAMAESRTFYLNYASAEGLPELLNRLVAEKLELTAPLQPHWAALKPTLKADAGQNALHADGSADALKALADALRAMDVPRPQLTLKYQYLRVPNRDDLLGAAVSPPLGDVESPGHGAAVNALLTPGDWARRAAELVAEGKARLLDEGVISAMDGYWGAIYRGDPEDKAPKFVFQARAVVAEGGALWLSVAYGTLRRAGGAPQPIEGLGQGGTPGEVCVSCGPGLGQMLLVPELVLTTRLEPGQSALAGGATWALEEAGSLAAPADRWVVVSAAVDEPPQ